MVRLLQINITANWGSHGKIAEGIGLLAMAKGWESHIAYGRWCTASQSELYHIGSNMDEAIHGIASRIFDNHGQMSGRATRKLIDHIESIHPDIIHLHNIHGYYLNYPLLFEYLRVSHIPVVWTLHDCWPYTGHCAHYMSAHCQQWQTHCGQCPQKNSYPRSMLHDRSYQNFEDKRRYFTALDNLTLVPVSKWLERELGKSFLKDKAVRQIYNGIDTALFVPSAGDESVRLKYLIPPKTHIILGVASNWYKKGLPDFTQLASLLDDKYTIVLVGLNKREMKRIPPNIVGVPRTESQADLVALYREADVYFNPTWEDNFPTTNLEALACGTPVVTYRTGGSPEAVGEGTGFVIAQGDLQTAVMLIENICGSGKVHYRQACRERAVSMFNREANFKAYLKLYEDILEGKKGAE